MSMYSPDSFSMERASEISSRRPLFWESTHFVSSLTFMLSQIIGVRIIAVAKISKIKIFIKVHLPFLFFYYNIIVRSLKIHP